MAKLEIPVVVDIDAAEELVEELKHLPIYKLGADDDLILVDRDAVVAIFARHVKAKQREKSDTEEWIGGELGRTSKCGHEGCSSDIWNGCKNFYCPNCGRKVIWR